MGESERSTRFTTRCETSIEASAPVSASTPAPERIAQNRHPRTVTGTMSCIYTHTQATVVYDDGRSWTGSVRQIHLGLDMRGRRLQDGVDI